MKDHLGSVRVVVDEAGEIVSSDDYDPWGMLLNGRSTDTAYLNVKYKFTGKERDTETGYDYFGARYYDSRIGRWMQVDPLEKESPNISPFVYANDNPITVLDLFGMDTIYYAPKPLPPVVVTASRDDNVQQTQVVPVPLPEPIPLPIPPVDLNTVKETGKKIREFLNDLNNINNVFKIGVITLIAPIIKPLIPNQFNAEEPSINQVNEQIKRGQAPSTIKRADKGKIYGEQDNIHFQDGSAINRDGSWKHGEKRLTNAEKEFLKNSGFKLPKGQ